MFINFKLTLVNDDPEIFLTELETIVVCMNKCVNTGRSNKSDTDIILQVIANFPKEYEIKIHQIKYDMEKDPTKVTIEVLRTELRARNNRITELNKNSKKKDEHALKAIM